MSDSFMDRLWKLGLDNPELRDNIIGQMDKDHRGYVIPTRLPLEGSDELETIEVRVETIEDPQLKTRLENAIKTCQDMTISELVKLANFGRIALVTEEAKGRKLCREEETLKDIDVMELAVMLLVNCLSYYTNKPEKIEEHTATDL